MKEIGLVILGVVIGGVVTHVFDRWKDKINWQRAKGEKDRKAMAEILIAWLERRLADDPDTLALLKAAVQDMSLEDIEGSITHAFVFNRPGGKKQSG